MINQLDDLLGFLVSNRCLSTNKVESWNNLRSIIHIFDLVVSVNDIDQVHELSFVFINSFDHDIEHDIFVFEIRNFFEINLLLNPINESLFVFCSHF